MSKPKVSVCIPVFNAELWLAESIQSIIDQTFQDWEIIIYNDCSTDSSLKIVEHYQKLLGDSKIDLFGKNSPESIGIASARNQCISHSLGEIICVQDADDISHKERLQKTWDFFKRHKTVDLTYGACQYIDMLGRPFHEVKADDFDFERLKKENWIQHPTVAYRRKAILETPYRSECRVLDDWFMYYDMHKAGKKIMPMQDTLSFYRVLLNSVSRSPEKAEEIAAMKKKFLEESNNAQS